MKFKPFRGLRPLPDRTGDVVSPPYDVINSAEARALAEGKPDSFLYVVRPEIGLEEGISRMTIPSTRQPERASSDSSVRECFSRMKRPLLLLSADLGSARANRDRGSGLVTDYDEGRIKKHEHTRQQKRMTVRATWIRPAQTRVPSF